MLTQEDIERAKVVVAIALPEALAQVLSELINELLSCSSPYSVAEEPFSIFLVPGHGLQPGRHTSGIKDAWGRTRHLNLVSHG